MKSLKYEKRKHLSNSPVRHLSPNSTRRAIASMHAHNMNPYSEERYSTSSAIPPQYPSPTRKKVRREPERYFGSESMSASPPRRHPAPPMHPESHMSRREAPPPMHEKHRRNPPPVPREREKHAYDGRSKHMSPPGIPSNHSKESSMKAQYPGESSGRYASASTSKGYSSGGQKSFGGPTLHERFSSVVESHRVEPRIKYSREDLEKITIDIRQNLRDSSPTLRHIMNPSDVKLVRRANEGHRPIFDREEIKQAPRDMRDDAYYERKKMSGSYSSNHGIDLREVENYQITRHRFDNHPDLFASGSGRTLNDRWQNPAPRKDPPSVDRDLREKEYQRIPVSVGYTGNRSRSRSRSRSGDRDFRSERYIDAKPTHSRSEYPSRPPVNIPDTRNSAPYPHRKSTMPVVTRQKLGIRKTVEHPSSVRSEVKGNFQPISERHYPGSMPPPRIERREHHPPIQEPQKWSYKSRSPSREKPDFTRRPEKMSYNKQWSDRPSAPPKGPNFYEHERRESSSTYQSRGSNRPFRSPRGSFRARGFRGSIRGSSFRGSFRGYGNSTSPRGRGMIRR